MVQGWGMSPGKQPSTFFLAVVSHGAASPLCMPEMLGLTAVVSCFASLSQLLGQCQTHKEH